MTHLTPARPGRLSLLRVFLHGEATGGLLLMAAAALAMLIANGALAGLYFDTLHARLGPMSVQHWINDGLMAGFFLLVGLEIKREVIEGHLSRWSDRALPALAALGGMGVPALIYLAIAGSGAGLARGWAIPSATDIAFAIGVMALLGKRVPASLKLFLTTVAIVDDMGAVAIIAFAYTSQIRMLALLAAAIVLATMIGMNRAGVRVLWPFLLLAVLLWVAVLLSGVHATIAGVLAAAAIPIRASAGAANGATSPLHRLERALHPWSAFGIVPLFGFANAGVALGGFGIAQLLSPLPLGVAAGLFFGKQIGVLGAVALGARLRIVQKPHGASWTQLYGTALLCGIGFTMSLFIGALAFSDPLRVDEVKIGVLGGSILSALIGAAVLGMAANRK